MSQQQIKELNEFIAELDQLEANARKLEQET